MSKIEPFIRRCLGADYTQLQFEKLSVSTSTLDARLVNNAGLDYELLFKLLQIETSGGKEVTKPPGTIFAGRCGSTTRGNPPTDSTTSLKNCTTVWMWLHDKHVNLKVFKENIHITGCKTIDHAAEAVRYLQMHIQMLHGDGFSLYQNFPYVIDFEVYMINYNFSTEVAIDLVKLDRFIANQYAHIAYSPYDVNVCATLMTLYCPSLCATFTLNDNGQISMCISKTRSFEEAFSNICGSYKLFYEMLEASRSS